MKNRSLYVSALALSTLLSLAACADNSAPAPAASSDSAHAHAQESSEASADSAAANEADMNFAAGMKAHHEQALEMSEYILDKDNVDPQVRELAEKIKAAQAPEIKQMNTWLQQWGMSEGMDHESMGHSDAMISDQEITALKEADGTKGAKLFLEQMIKHHEGALDMAKTEIADGSNPSVIKMSEDIVASQAKEIEQMKEMLADL